MTSERVISVHPRGVRQLSVAITVLGYAAAVVVAAELVQARDWSNLAPVALPFFWLVAASVAVRARPDHPGALLFVILGAGHLTAAALDYPVAADPGAAGWGAWTVNVLALTAYGLGFAGLGAFLATYPGGLARTRAERVFLRLVFPLVVVGVLLDALTHRRVELGLEVDGHSAIPAPGGLPLGPVPISVGVVVPLLVLVGVVLLVVRGRRSNGDDRRQMVWAVGAGGLLALMIAADPLLERLFSPDAASTAFVVVASVIPFVLLGGLVRHRVLDVDLYVTRTLAGGAAVVIALAAYTVVAELTADSRAATAVVVVAAALTGMPLVRALSRVADRWFSGGRVRGHALLRRLSDTLADSSDVDLAGRTARTVAEGLDVAWVRVGDRTVGTVVGEPALRVPLGDAETLECGPRHGGWTAAEVAEVELLARHAGLALDNTAYADRLAEQVDELRASRLRLVRAELDVRRGLERDLHDGVQQQVVALLAYLGSLRLVVGADARAAGLLDAAQEQARLCLEELRAVVDGVHPPALLDRGVVAAIESRATLLPLPVEIRSTWTGRAVAELEAAAYYVVSEALTNVVKHAEARRAHVCFDRDGEGLVVTVTDDGRGRTTITAGRGLAGLRDRVEALGGRLEVSSGATGTTVRARIPESAGA